MMKANQKYSLKSEADFWETTVKMDNGCIEWLGVCLSNLTMKTFFFWLVNVALVMLCASAFWDACTWHKSITATHATADVLMYWYETLRLFLCVFLLVYRLNNKPEAAEPEAE